MRRLADLCARRGYTVTGSDIALCGHNPCNVLGADLVVYTAAAEQNVERIEAERLGIPTMTRAELLGAVCNGFSRTIAIAGAHGKTTAVGFTGKATAAYRPEVHIGGDVAYDCCGGNELFVVEACEFKRSFLQLHPTVAAVLNIDLDHTDCYRDVGQVFDAFSTFTARATDRVVVNADDPYCAQLPAKTKVTFGLGDADYRAAAVMLENGRPSFILCHNAERIPMRLNTPGKHNVYNALCAVACAHVVGVPLWQAAADACAFTGVKRRFEKVGELNGAEIYTDYAHHPHELAATVATARACGAKRVVAVFEPHTFTRTAALKDGFVDALSAADEVLLLPIYPARECPIRGVTSLLLWPDLRARGVDASCFDTYCMANAYLAAHVREGDFVLYLGAGTVDRAALLLLQEHPSGVL